MDDLRRNFLWQENKEKKGLHKVKWKNLIISKKDGPGNQKPEETKEGSSANQKPEVTMEVHKCIMGHSYKSNGKEGFWMTKKVQPLWNQSVENYQKLMVESQRRIEI